MIGGAQRAVPVCNHACHKAINPGGLGAKPPSRYDLFLLVFWCRVESSDDQTASDLSAPLSNSPLKCSQLVVWNRGIGMLKALEQFLCIGVGLIGEPSLDNGPCV